MKLPQYRLLKIWAEDMTTLKAEWVELVTCKECNAYMTDGYADGCGFCAYHQSVVKADDFCSYGEPKTEPTSSKMEQVEDEPQTDCSWR